MVDAGLMALVGVGGLTILIAISIPFTLVLLRPGRGRRSS